MFTKLMRQSSKMNLIKSQFNQFNRYNRQFSTLVLAEHLDGNLNGNIASSLTAANELNDSHVDVLLHGSESSISS